jgi:hypothetical protein
VFAVSGRLGFYPKYFGLFNVCYYFVGFGLEIATERQALERYKTFNPLSNEVIPPKLGF